jgi:hypothetical protein
VEYYILYIGRDKIEKREPGPDFYPSKWLCRPNLFEENEVTMKQPPRTHLFGYLKIDEIIERL